MNDLVSIIMPSYNSEKFIAESIQSVKNQTYLNWELIIVDDGSTDQTLYLVNNFCKEDSRIKFTSLQKNFGAGVARNRALQEATGKYIAFLDSDDVWKPEKIQKQISFLQEKKLSFTFSFYDCISEDGIHLNKRILAPLKLTYSQLFFSNYVGNLTAIYDAEKLGKIAINKIRKRQDWIVWLTILKKTKIAQPVPESLAYYRIRKNSVSSSKILLLKYNYKVYRQFHKLNIFVSFLAMVGFVFVHFFIKPRYIRSIQ